MEQKAKMSLQNKQGMANDSDKRFREGGWTLGLQWGWRAILHSKD